MFFNKKNESIMLKDVKDIGNVLKAEETFDKIDDAFEDSKEAYYKLLFADNKIDDFKVEKSKNNTITSFNDVKNKTDFCDYLLSTCSDTEFCISEANINILKNEIKIGQIDLIMKNKDTNYAVMVNYIKDEYEDRGTFINRIIEVITYTEIYNKKCNSKLSPAILIPYDYDSDDVSDLIDYVENSTTVPSCILKANFNPFCYSIKDKNQCEIIDYYDMDAFKENPDSFDDFSIISDDIIGDDITNNDIDSEL